jgi:POT family proton-dependent oligopeptide transporter
MKQNKTAQPAGLYLLFFTELWERFGFYTLQTIIILYMSKGLLMQDTDANLLYAAFSGLLYLTPTIGGYLADRYLGFQRAIIFGGLLFVVGYLLTALPGKQTFFLGLSIIICANGFFKPNVSSIVGELYGRNDPRRDGGFTLFYMGINIGALIPPVIAGALVARYGWHAGFFLAAIGMIIGQLVFQLGRKQLNGAGLYPNVRGGRSAIKKRFYVYLLLGVVAAIALFYLALQFPRMTSYMIEGASVLLLAVVIFFLFKQPVLQRNRMFAALILIIISVGFWSLYNQAFTSLMFFADRNMNQHFLGFNFDAEATQFFNPFFIILLSPVLSRLWVRMDGVGLNPSTQMKFFLGVLMMSAGYLLLAYAAHFCGDNGQVSAGWLCASYVLQTMGELLISPIGLAMITVLCPKELVGMMMGVWFFAQTVSFTIGGMLANIAAVPAHLSVVASLAVYAHAFTVFGLISLVMTMISLLCVPFINRLVRA